MTLIPLMSSVLSSRRARGALVDGDPLARGGYDPGAGHRPFAAVLAVGLPAVMLAAVALSPMISVIIEKTKPTVVKSIPIPIPPDPEVKPRSDPMPDPPVTAPVPRTEVPPIVPIDLRPPPPIEIPISMTGGGGSEVVGSADPPAPPPKLVLAQLDRRHLGAFQPDYPPREQRGGIEGVVKVRVLIGTDGRVKTVQLVSTDSPGFFEATKRRALAKWRFKPATRGGTPEESWKEMTVRFEIKNA